MKNVVTFETAKRLRDAGFLQPEMASGQFGYIVEPQTGIARLFVVGRPGVGGFCVYPIEGDFTGFSFSVDRFVIAPTATDILQQLGYDYALGYDEDRQIFWVKKSGELIAFSKTAPECCAAAFLYKNSK